MKISLSKIIMGRTIMVHPSLTTDPIQRQGEIGKVIGVDKKNEDILTVQFSDGKKGAYFSDALLTLYPLPVILQGLRSNIDSLLPREKETILEIQRLIHRGKKEDALKLAKNDTTTSFFCMTTCDRWIEMKMSRSTRKRSSNKLK